MESDILKDVINKLILNNKTISTMESCTGGGLANEITNCEDSSKVFKFSAITYSNEYKIKMGVSSDVIDKYSVYSIETAREMAIAISNFTDSNYGIGITGKLNKADSSNPYGKDNCVFVTIYDRDNDSCYDLIIDVFKSTRSENKEYVIDNIIKKLNILLEVL